ncbi:Lrp/AsnC family transcriptional regulator, leucine-responsive regulatory protein [Rhizobiales bacterium GAS191]|nr:Lrp/AsnC family transcriptional regulator, leucine-responsive regulatory protein [Rhizobiales bacterium GAS113]SEE45057.1 Lrp/AsnC family transcriptional regulator, leucine-responsive regulatory protein [Rhizobiales bacterium GAS191]
MKANNENDLRVSSLLRDERNLELIRLLQADPRAGISELARQIGMSAPAVRERLTRLEEAGVITGYRLDLDPKALGWPIMVFVRVRPMPGQLPRIAELAQSIPQVAECHRITGEDCFILKIHLDALESLDRILDRFLAFGQTTTSIVQSTPVKLRSPPLPNGAGG